MTVQSTDRTAGPFVGNGVQTAFPFTFRVFTNADVLATVTDTNGDTVELTLSSDYIVSVNADQNGNPGGVVALLAPLAAGSTLDLTTKLDATQLTNITNAGGFYPQVIENALDKVTILLQQQGVFGRSALRVPETSGVSVLPAAVARAGKILAFDGLGNPVMLVGADSDSATALQLQLADMAVYTRGPSMIGLNQALNYAAGTLGDHANNGEWLATDYPWLCDNTGLTDSSAARDAFLLACAAANKIAKFPAGQYKFSTPITVAKPHRVKIVGEGALYSSGGTVFTFSSVTGATVVVGVADGNPDSTGFTEDFLLKDVTLITAAGATTAVRMTNCSQSRLVGVKTRAYTGKIFDFLGGNVITKIIDCEPFGVASPTCFAMYFGDYQFGHYVVEIDDNHIGSAGYAARFGRGRSFDFRNNVVERLTSGVFKFDGALDISDVNIFENYGEANEGLHFDGTGFTASLYALTVKNNRFWPGSAPAAFGNLPRSRVFMSTVEDNFAPDAAWNASAALGLSVVFSSTSIFDRTTTIVADPVTGKEYEDALVYALRPADLLKSHGDMATLSGSNGPFGWANLSAAPWVVSAEEFLGRFAVNTPAAAEFDKCERVFALSPVNRVRYFAMAFTFKGWLALRVNGVSILDTGASLADPTTLVAKFQVAANATSFTAKLGTNTGAFLTLAEVRCYEIGPAEFNEPGGMAFTLDRAVRRCLKRGAY